MNILSSLKSFSELNTQELYEILKLRSHTFIMEQQCLYQDLDDMDQIAMHFSYHENKQLIGCARVLAYDEHSMSFGRLIIAPSHRRLGMGKRLMDDILYYLHKNYPTKPITITAQDYLRDFYASYGFKAQGDVFMHEQRLHLKMVKAP